MPQEETVTVKTRDGAQWEIPKANLSAAQSRGAVLVPTFDPYLIHPMQLGPSTLPKIGLKKETAAESLPLVGGGVGGAVGSMGGPVVGALGAGMGGMVGEAANLKLRKRMGLPTPTSKTKEVLDVAGQGALQVLYDVVPKTVYAGLARGLQASGAKFLETSVGKDLLAKVPSTLRDWFVEKVSKPVVGETIGGVTMPETYGQKYGKPGGLTQTVEHYASKTFIGGPLKEVQHLQESATKEILAKLSKASDQSPEALAKNWATAVQDTRIAAEPLYKSLEQVESPLTAKASASILEDLPRISTKVRLALQKASGVGGSEAEQYAKDLAKALGYKDFLDPALVKQLPKEMQEQLQSSSKATIGDAIAARSELRDLATHTTDRNEARIYRDAEQKMTDAIQKSLTPRQKLVLQQADTLWRRSYIMEEIKKSMETMENAYAPGSSNVVVNPFVKMVNKLARQPLGRSEGKVVEFPSKMEVLFEKPEDRKAMIDLAKFLKTKYSTMGGQAGLSESIARIGVALEAIRIPGQVLMGKEKAASMAMAGIAGIYALATQLADPGGALLVRQYFSSSGATATAIAARIAALTIKGKQGIQREDQNGSQP